MFKAAFDFSLLLINHSSDMVNSIWQDNHFYQVLSIKEIKIIYTHILLILWKMYFDLNQMIQSFMVNRNQN